MSTDDETPPPGATLPDIPVPPDPITLDDGECERLAALVREQCWRARAEAAEAERDAAAVEAVRHLNAADAEIARLRSGLEAAEAKLAAIEALCRDRCSYAITRSTSEAIVQVPEILAIIGTGEEPS